jgi:hypothetical protein
MKVPSEFVEENVNLVNVESCSGGREIKISRSQEGREGGSETVGGRGVEEV